VKFDLKEGAFAIIQYIVKLFNSKKAQVKTLGITLSSTHQRRRISDIKTILS
jgi:hypothetical protein